MSVRQSSPSNIVIGNAISGGTNNTILYIDGSGNLASNPTTLSPTFVRLTLSQATGTSPLAITSTTVCTNLNADLLDGLHVATSGSAVPNMNSANTWAGIQTFGTTNEVRFRDSGQAIWSSAASTLDIKSAATMNIASSLTTLNIANTAVTTANVATGAVTTNIGAAGDIIIGSSGFKFGLFGNAGAVRQTDGANLTNNVTAGGTDNTIADYTDLVIYANDASAIRNNIYQLARKVKIIGDALRAYNALS